MFRHPTVAHRVLALGLVGIAVTLSPVSGIAAALQTGDTATPTATTTPVPTAIPTVTPTTTPTPVKTLLQVWADTMRAVQSIKSAHSVGLFTDKTSHTAFVGNCVLHAKGPSVLDIRLTGKDKMGRARGVEYVSAGSNFWSRTRAGAGPWTRWKKGAGYNADIFIGLIDILCPSVYAKGLATLSRSQLKSYLQDLGTAEVSGNPTRRIRLAVKQTSDDFYVDPATSYWVLLQERDTKQHSLLTVAYSQFNHVTFKAPGS